MGVERTEAVVIGGGQAGIAMSEHLSKNGIPHLVLERGRVAERWRSERWDSLVTNGPAWHDHFPGLAFPAVSPDGFVPKEQVADYFAAYAKQINAPLRTGVAATRARRRADGPGFLVETSDGGQIEARYIVAATGAFQSPVIPNLVPAEAGVLQIHSTAYRNPAGLPEGAVLVVGAGSSGAQIAAELLEHGRKVYLSVGHHDRPPRAYRGRDFVWWLGVLNKWDAEATPGKKHTTIAVSGAHGGKTVDFRALAHRGMVLVGRAQSYRDGTLHLAPDLVENVRSGDAYYLALLDECDAFAARNGLDLPEEPQARILPPDPDCMTNPLASIDLAQAGVSTIIWATGFSADYRWLKVDTFDATGRPIHQRGISREPGVYFLGLPWQTRRGSAFIWGVWYDAKYLGDHIAKQSAYLAYAPQTA